MRVLQRDTDAPWKRRFRAAITYGVQTASEAPERGLAVSDQTGVSQLYAWDMTTGALRQLTTRPDGVGLTGDGMVSGVLAPDGAFVYFLDDRLGDETGHFVRLPYTGGAAEDITPDMPPYHGFALDFSRDGRRLGFTAILGGEYRIYTFAVGLNGTLGEPALLYRSAQQTIGPILAANGALAVIETKRPGSGSYDLLALDVANGEELARLVEEDAGLEIYLASPASGDTRWLALSSASGYARPLLWNPVTGERADLLLEEIAGDITPLDWSADGARLLLRQDTVAAQRLYLYNIAGQTATLIPQDGGAIGTTEPRTVWFGPGDRLFARWESSAHPPCTIARDLDGANTDWHVVLKGAAAPAGGQLRSITFISSDGAAVQGWLVLPDGAGPFPAIIEAHGGPEFAVTDVYSPPSQVWLDHGFAYLTVNYRGSTGFGATFQEQIRGDLGHWEVEDLAAARGWLVGQGIAAPGAIFLTGWSYGGYLTLMALGKRPDLWAGGMAGVALADLAANDANGSMIASYLRGLMGGAPNEFPERYAASSPITYVEPVAAPILILQGRHDARCPAGQIEAYEAAMRALGKDITIHWFESGHIDSDVERRIQQYELMLRFTQEILKRHNGKD
jgi:dipeptidyl aminopeptidase/acylaminoacyl peptidase